MKFPRKKGLNLVRADHEELFFNINANRAAELIDKDQIQFEITNKKKRDINPVLLISFNGITKKTKKKLATNNPTWDEIISFRLKSYDQGQLIHFSVWDKHRSYKNYLGELRLDIIDIFKIDGTFISTTDPKWYKLYSDTSQKSFVTGSLLLSFELVVKTISNGKHSEKSEPPKIIVNVNPPTRENTETDVNDRMKLLNLSDMELSTINTSNDHISRLFENWLKSLIYSDNNRGKAVSVNEQGFYDNSAYSSDILEYIVGSGKRNYYKHVVN